MITPCVATFLLCLAALVAHAEPVLIEAESFKRQALAEKRRWHVFSAGSTPEVTPDGDPAHLEGASGGSYIELLPDTRRSHDDELVKGENFTEAGGTMAVLSYTVTLPEAGEHELLLSMREDGIEVDQIALTTDVNWRPDGTQR